MYVGHEDGIALCWKTTWFDDTKDMIARGVVFLFGKYTKLCQGSNQTGNSQSADRSNTLYLRYATDRTISSTLDGKRVHHSALTTLNHVIFDCEHSPVAVLVTSAQISTRTYRLGALSKCCELAPSLSEVF